MARITGRDRRVGLPRVAVHQGDTVREVPVHWGHARRVMSLFAVCDACREALVDQTSK
jgi:hypothetical protein